MATTIYTISYSGLAVGDTVTLFYRKTSEDTATELPYTRASESDDSTKQWALPNIEYDVTYVYSIRLVTADGTTTWPTEGATFVVASPEDTPTYSITNVTSTTATATIRNISSGAEVTFRVLIGNQIQKSTTTTSEASTVTLTITGLSPSTAYTAQAFVNGTALGDLSFTTNQEGSDPVVETFEWDTNISRGAKIAMWQNPANGAKSPAPVTAIEWNRLVDLVNQKCGTNISGVSSGTRMHAASGGNVRLVADALGVSVASDDIVTAQFFLDLADAINNYGT